MSNTSVKPSLRTDRATDGIDTPIVAVGVGVAGAVPGIVDGTNTRLPTDDFLIEVAKGNIAGHSIQNISGRNGAVGTVFEDIWGGGLLSTINYDAQSGNFTPGLVLTGGTSDATAIIVTDIDNGTTGTLTIRKISGTFQNDETITDSSTGSATSNGTVTNLLALIYPTAGETWEMIAESADDTSAGTGARTVLTVYLDADRVQQTTTTSLNGQTAVTMTPTDSFCHVISVVQTWGSGTDAIYGKTNTGSIIIRDSVSKNIRSIIPFDDSVTGDEHGFNVTRDTHATIPSGKTGYITNVFTNTSKNHESDTALLVRPFGTDGFVSGGQVSVYQSTTDHDTTKGLQSIAAKTDLKFISRSNNAAVDVNVAYSILLVDD